MPLPRLPRPQHRGWIALPILAIAGIQALTGIPHPDYFAARGSQGLLADFSHFAFTPPSDLRNFFHLPLFAGLAACLVWALLAWVRSPRTAVLISLGVAGLFAVLNEGSQAFIPTRTATLSDLGHDVLGVVIGCLLALVTIRSGDS